MEESAKRSLHFETQAPDEEIILLLRAHVITNLPWIFLVTILFFVPTFLGATNLFEPLIGPLNISTRSARFLSLIWYLLTFAIALQNILSWYFNVYILTNKRIVDIDFHQLLYRKISSTELSNVQDITYTRGGIPQALFDYGDLHIQTAGTLPQFEFLKVPKPSALQKQIEKSVEEYKNGL
jgi:hypothetical protein